MNNFSHKYTVKYRLINLYGRVELVNPRNRLIIPFGSIKAIPTMGRGLKHMRKYKLKKKKKNQRNAVRVSYIYV
jgi:hypothetical protein